MSDLLKRDQVRELVATGVSEMEATRRVYRVGSDPADGDPADDRPVAPDRSARHFVVVSKDFSGLGWATRLQADGETVTLASVFTEETDPELRKAKQQVGTNWLTVLTLEQAVKTLQSDQTYWVFSENAFSEEADELRAAGQKVFGTSALSDRLEHDREYAIEVAEDAGLLSPPTHPFQGLDEAVAFLEAHPDTAYVFKPDDGQFSHMTFVPTRQDDAEANLDLSMYLSHMPEDPGAFILQERIPRKEALEVNAEVWLYEGEPFLATCGLELKRRNTGEMGEMCGSSADTMTVIPLESPLVKQTIGLLLPFFKKERYTGTADVNVLITKDGEPYFLEFCCRLGYNASVTLLLGLATDQLGNILADWMDGHVEDFADRFKTGFGASLTVFCDHPRPGLPVHVDPSLEGQFYPFDGYREDDQLLLTGYSDEIGILVESGPTIEAAAAKVLGHLTAEWMSVPDGYWRTDLGGSFKNAPATRYAELQRRKLL